MLSVGMSSYGLMLATIVLLTAFQVTVTTTAVLWQVLLSEEVTGSLRKLPATATLTRDRFKSLQKQGIIEPRAAVKNKRVGKRVSYTHGDRADRAAAGMQELRQLQGK